MSCYANASSALPRKDGGVCVLGVGGLEMASGGCRGGEGGGGVGGVGG